MVTSGTNMRTRAWQIVGLVLVALFAFQADAQAQQLQFASTSDNARAVTFSGDVAEIIFNNCTRCHREGGIGPMNLVTYQDVRRYAQRIKYQVGNGLMPPYAYDRDVGIQNLAEDWRLSLDQIQTIVDWVDQGAPLGDADAVPPLPDIPDPSAWS
ncbi:MAG: cytochrome c, partial [Gemmatimonadota bacterium]